MGGCAAAASGHRGPAWHRLADSQQLAATQPCRRGGRCTHAAAVVEPPRPPPSRRRGRGPPPVAACTARAHLFTSSSSCSSSSLRCRMRSSWDSIAGVMWALWSDRRPQRGAAAVNRRAHCPRLPPLCCRGSGSCWWAGCQPSREGSVASTRACPAAAPAGPAACKGAAAAAAATLQAAGGGEAAEGKGRRMRLHCTGGPVTALLSPEQRREGAPACGHTAQLAPGRAGAWIARQGSLELVKAAMSVRGTGFWLPCPVGRPVSTFTSRPGGAPASIQQPLLHVGSAGLPHGAAAAPAAARPFPALSCSGPGTAAAGDMAKRKQHDAAEPPNEPAAAGAAGDEPATKRRRSPRSAPRAAAQAASPPVRRGTQSSSGAAAAATAAAAAAGRAESDVAGAAEEEQAAAAALPAEAGGAAAQQPQREQSDEQRGPQPASGAAGLAGGGQVSPASPCGALRRCPLHSCCRSQPAAPRFTVS